MQDPAGGDTPSCVCEPGYADYACNAPVTTISPQAGATTSLAVQGLPPGTFMYFTMEVRCNRMLANVFPTCCQLK